MGDPDELDSVDAALREARASADKHEALAGNSRRPAELDVAWKLFETVRERDPEAVADKASILATFAECFATVRHPPADPLWHRLQGSADDLDGDVPF